MSAARYTIQTFWDEDDEGYVAIVPDLPGCSAFGETREQAVAEIGDAIEAWIAAAAAAGNPVPQPTPHAEVGEFSGKVLIRMPRELHRDLSKAAEREGVSLNQYAVYLLSGNHVARVVERSTASRADEAPERAAHAFDPTRGAGRFKVGRRLPPR